MEGLQTAAKTCSPSPPSNILYPSHTRMHKYTPWTTEHTGLQTYILPARLDHSWSVQPRKASIAGGLVSDAVKTTHKCVTEISVVIFNLCESMLNNMRLLVYFSNYSSSSIWLIESLTHMQTDSVSLIHTLKNIHLYSVYLFSFNIHYTPVCCYTPSFCLLSHFGLLLFNNYLQTCWRNAHLFGWLCCEMRLMFQNIIALSI